MTANRSHRIEWLVALLLVLVLAGVGYSASNHIRGPITIDNGCLIVARNDVVKRTFSICLDADSGLSMTSGDTGAPGFALGRIANDDDPMNDTAYAGLASTDQLATMYSNPTAEQGVCLTDSDRSSSTASCLLRDLAGAGQLITDEGRFRDSVYSDVGAGRGNTFEYSDVTLSSGAATGTVAEGHQINWCFPGGYLNGAARTFTPNVGWTAAERTFSVKADDGTPTGYSVRVVCNVSVPLD